MKRTIISAIVLIAIGFSACTDTKTEEEKTENIQTQKTNNMNNLISIVEIPTTDFARALKFYQAILGVTIEEVDMDGMLMGVLPSDGETVNVVLVNGNDYKPITVEYSMTEYGATLAPVINEIAKWGIEYRKSLFESGEDK